jgi:hypothetical protein
MIAAGGLQHARHVASLTLIGMARRCSVAPELIPALPPLTALILRSSVVGGRLRQLGVDRRAVLHLVAWHHNTDELAAQIEAGIERDVSISW